MTEDREIVLASASPRRRELLGQIGIVPEIIPSTLEEKITTDRPEDVVKELSLQKAADVAERCAKGTIVIGADTVVAAEGRILGKPKSHDRVSGWEDPSGVHGSDHDRMRTGRQGPQDICGEDGCASLSDDG